MNEQATITEAEPVAAPAAPPILLRTDIFRDAFKIAARAIQARTPKPILQSVLLEWDGNGKASVTGTDLETSMRVTFPAPNVDGPGAMLLPHERVGRILGLCPDDDIGLEPTESGIRISCLRSGYELVTDTPANYPSPNVLPAGAGWHTVAGEDLKTLFERTTFATDQKSVRYALGGVLLELGPDRLTGVGTDGRRVAVQSVPAGSVGPGARWNTPDAAQTIVPLKLIRQLTAVLDDDAEVQFTFNHAESIFIRTGNVRAWGRLLSGRYPRYRDAIPKSTSRTFEMPAKDLTEVVRMAALAVAKEDTRGVRFALADGQLTLETTEDETPAPKGGKGARRMRASAPALFGGPEFAWLADPEYLAECLATVEPDALVSFDMDRPNTAIVVRPADHAQGREYRYIFMPMETGPGKTPARPATAATTGDED